MLKSNPQTDLGMGPLVGKLYHESGVLMNGLLPLEPEAIDPTGFLPTM
jgi:hypothetical protein